MDKTPILEGQQVHLKPLSEEDVPLLARWLFDPEILHWLQLSEDPPELRTIEAVRERYQSMQADPWTKVWRIDTKEGEPIGQIELVNIHRLHKRAEMHIAIGEKDYWSGGYGRDAIRRIVQFAFEDLGLQRVYVTPDADNVRAIQSFTRCGFVREGVLRSHRQRYGEPVDMILLGILRNEFL